MENTATPEQQDIAAPVESADVNTELLTNDLPDPSPDGQEQQEAAPEAIKPKVDPVQKRIDQITRQRYDAERQASEYALQLQQAQWERQALEQRLQAHEAQRNLPDPRQYATPEDYHYAIAQQQQQAALQQQEQFNQQQARQQQAIRQQQAMQQHQAYIQSNVTTLTAEGAAKYQDFDAVISNHALPDLNRSHPAVLAALFSSEKKADIAYYLGKNPAEAHKLAALPPINQIAEIGRIEARLSSGVASKTPPKPLSSAPTGTSSATRNLGSMSMREFMDYRDKQEANRRK